MFSYLMKRVFIIPKLVWAVLTEEYVYAVLLNLALVYATSGLWLDMCDPVWEEVLQTAVELITRMCLLAVNIYYTYCLLKTEKEVSALKQHIITTEDKLLMWRFNNVKSLRKLIQESKLLYFSQNSLRDATKMGALTKMLNALSDLGLREKEGVIGKTCNDVIVTDCIKVLKEISAGCCVTERSVNENGSEEFILEKNVKDVQTSYRAKTETQEAKASNITDAVAPQHLQVKTVCETTKICDPSCNGNVASEVGKQTPAIQSVTKESSPGTCRKNSSVCGEKEGVDTEENATNGQHTECCSVLNENTEGSHGKDTITTTREQMRSAYFDISDELDTGSDKKKSSLPTQETPPMTEPQICDDTETEFKHEMTGCSTVYRAENIIVADKEHVIAFKETTDRSHENNLSMTVQEEMCSANLDISDEIETKSDKETLLTIPETPPMTNDSRICQETTTTTKICGKEELPVKQKMKMTGSSAVSRSERATVAEENYVVSDETVQKSELPDASIEKEEEIQTNKRPMACRGVSKFVDSKFFEKNNLEAIGKHSLPKCEQKHVRPDPQASSTYSKGVTETQKVDIIIRKIENNIMTAIQAEHKTKPAVTSHVRNVTLIREALRKCTGVYSIGPSAFPEAMVAKKPQEAGKCTPAAQEDQMKQKRLAEQNLIADHTPKKNKTLGCHRRDVDQELKETEELKKKEEEILARMLRSKVNLRFDSTPVPIVRS